MKTIVYTKALSIALLFSSLAYGIDSPYKVAGEIALQAEDHIKLQPEKLSAEQKAALAQQKAAIEKDIRKAKPHTVPLSDFEKKEILFNLFAELPKPEIQTVANKQSVQELHILCGDTNSRKSSILNRLKATTTAGHAVLAAQLSQPLVDITTIKKRQTFIKELVENPVLLEQFEVQLQKIKANESSLLEFWKDHDDIQQKVFEQVYLPKFFGRYNDNPKALEAFRAWQNIWQGFGYLPAMWFMSFVQPMMNNIEKYDRGEQNLKTFLYKTFTGSIRMIGKEPFYGHIPWESSYSVKSRAKNYISQNEIENITLGDRYNIFKSQGYPTWASFGATYGWRAILDLWTIYRIIQATNTIQFTKSIKDHLHTKMNGVAQVLDGFKNLNALIENNQVLKQNLTSSDVLDKLCTKSYGITSKMNQFMKLMATNTFKGEPTVLSLRGRVLAAVKLLPQVKENLVPALEVIGELDAYVTVAKNIRAFEQEPVHYCFAEFIDSALPHVVIEEGWNPLVNPKLAVPVTITLGQSDGGMPNVMLTGPHGCGKSTTMEAIAYNVYLAHVYGIGFARSLTLAPVTKMLTYMDIKQNREEGFSTFMAEAQRVDQIERDISLLKPTDRCLTIMDEVFKGTMQEEGAKRLYRFGEKVIQVQQNICIFATHFREPTVLEEESNGRIINLHVGLEEPEVGNFRPTYKLIPGINTWWFEDKEKRERYIDWLRKHNNLEKTSDLAQAA